jgi:large subunit ribosomal protein L6
MSRIGRLPVVVPNGVQINVQGSDVHVKGPKGELKRTFSPLLRIALENGELVVTRQSDNPRERALHGTTRAVIANMVHGVSSGFEIVLQVEGVGYRAELQGKDLALFVGYSHPVKVPPPAGISFEVDQKTRQVKVQAMTVSWSVRRPLRSGASAPPNPTMAREFVMPARRSVGKPVRPGKEPSKPWRIILVPSHERVVIHACARILPARQNVRV